MRHVLLVLVCVSSVCEAANPPSTEREVPGLRVSVPAWTAQEVGGSPGSVKLTPPTGNGRFVELRWRHGQVAATDQFVATQEEVLGARAEPLASVVAGRPAEGLWFEPPGGKKVAVTRWRCPESGLTYTLTTFLSLERGALLAVHDGILASAACVAWSPPPPVYPRYSVPEGFTDQGVDGERTLLGPLGDLLSISPAHPGRKLADGLALAEVRAATRSHALGLEDAVEDEPVVRGDRTVWLARGRIEGVDARVALTAFHCAVSDVSFFALHVSPAELPPRLDDLFAIGCP